MTSAWSEVSPSSSGSVASSMPAITTLVGPDPPSDSVELAAAIARLAADAPLRERLGMSGRQRVLDLYDLERNVERLAEIFYARISS